jgi:MoaD family protein
MKKIKFRTFANLREYIGSKTLTIHFEGSTLNEFINFLCVIYPQIKSELFKKNEFNSYYIVIVNDEKILPVNFKDKILLNLDQVAILPPTGGGC